MGQQKTANGASAAYLLVDQIFTRQVMTLFSWTGLNKPGKDAKKPFKCYVNIMQLFSKVVRPFHSTYTVQDAQKFFKECAIQHAKRRFTQYKGQRVSAPKSRTMGRNDVLSTEEFYEENEFPHQKMTSAPFTTVYVGNTATPSTVVTTTENVPTCAASLPSLSTVTENNATTHNQCPDKSLQDEANAAAPSTIVATTNDAIVSSCAASLPPLSTVEENDATTHNQCPDKPMQDYASTPSAIVNNVIVPSCAASLPLFSTLKADNDNRCPDIIIQPNVLADYEFVAEEVVTTGGVEEVFGPKNSDSDISDGSTNNSNLDSSEVKDSDSDEVSELIADEIAAVVMDEVNE